MITLKEVTTNSDLKRFVKFPFTLYKDCPQWVPPIIKEELDSFNRRKNPAFRDAAVWFFLAYKDGVLAGRVAIVINWIEVRQQGIPKIRFGWFDFIDDPEVSKTLLSKVEEIGRSHHLEFMEGPLGFSNLDKVGVLTEGFETSGTMITWYNYPYYSEHLDTLGFKREKLFIESKFPANESDPDHYKRSQEVIKKRYGLRVQNFEKPSQIMPLAYKMFDLFNKSYASLPSFVPITDIQIEYFKKKYLRYINPEYIKFVFDSEDQLIAFAIVMPSYSEALKKARGKLFPFGIFHLARARNNSKDVLFYLIGILPEYQKKGVTALIIYEFHQTFWEKGIINCYRSPELEDNLAIQQMWKYFKPVVYKRRCTYKRMLNTT